MPRKKKPGHSPTRTPGLAAESSNTGHRQGTTSVDEAMASSSSSSNLQLPNCPYQDKTGIVRNMQEIFSHLDPEVIHIVLAECDFKVENAMDSLLELSVAAEGVAPAPTPISGFELTAALLSSQPPESDPDQDTPPSSGEPPSSPSQAPPQNEDDLDLSADLTEEFDLLIDRELETLTNRGEVEGNAASGRYPSTVSLSSLPTPPAPRPPLPELLQTSMEPTARGGPREQPCPGRGPSLGQGPGAHCHVSQPTSLLDFSHLTPSETKSNSALDLGAAGRPSAFQAYRKQGQSIPSMGGQGVPPGGIVGGARAKTNASSASVGGEEEEQQPQSTAAMFWNTEVAEFAPRVHGGQAPAFIIPVAGNPSPWNTQTIPASQWLGQGAVSRAPLKPAATVPKSWSLAASSPRAPLPHGRLHLEGRVLVLLRGAPGSGKSTMARAMLEQNPGGVVLSTDDYFSRHGDYHFDPSALGEAHEWNHKRAKDAFESGMSPVIIDNTNMQGWEMKPYVAQALKHKYKVLFREPDTWWRKKPRELQRRTKHGVPVEKIRRMLDGYDRFVNIRSIMGSQAPERERVPQQDNRTPQQDNRTPQQDSGLTQPLTSDTAQPDLVGKPQSAEASHDTRSRPQLFSFLPDVSSVAGSGNEGTPGHGGGSGSQGSTESLRSGNEGTPGHSGGGSGGGSQGSTESLRSGNGAPENRETPEDEMDFGELDSELDAQLELEYGDADRGMPDCVVELPLNADRRAGDTMAPPLLSESIGQRARRTRRRRSRKPGSGGAEPADLVKDTNQRGGREGEVEGGRGREEAEFAAGGGERVRPELLDFVGDWPSQGGLGQRAGGGRKGRRSGERGEGEGADQEAGRRDDERATEGHAFPDVTEFRKLLDLIQTGADSSPENDRSFDSDQSSREEGERGGAGGSGEESRSSASGDGRDQVLGRGVDGRAELPDCVLDWKASDSSLERTPLQSVMVESESEGLAEGEGLPTAEEGGVETEGVKLEEGKKQGDFLSAASKDGVEVEGGHDGEDIQITEASHVSKVNVGQSDIGTGNIGGHIGEVSSLSCEGGAEGDVGHVGGGSQERRQRQSRRSGKQCKLALTFTQNCPSPSSPKPLLANPEAAGPDHDPSLSSDPEPRPLTPPSSAETGRSAQTDPRDFALLWRLHRRPHDDSGSLADSSGLAVVRSDPSRFLPELSLAAPAAVPYRVLHEKGTQLEESELGGAASRLQSLTVLSRHFKLVSFDTLEDLYDKCGQDLEWTTELLLDSGERLFRDDGDWGAEDLAAFALYGGLDLAAAAGPGPDEERRCLEPDGVEGGGGDGMSRLVMAAGEGEGGVWEPGVNGGSARVSRGLQPSPSATGLGPEVASGSDVIEQEVTSETASESGAATLEDGAESEEARGEEEEEEEGERAGDEGGGELSLSLLAQLAEIERMEVEEKREREKRRSRHLDIRSVELKLPTELALQLTELFGPVGVDPGACSADDYAVRMDLKVARLLHQQWKDTIQEKQRQAALSYHLLQESSVHWGEAQAGKTAPSEGPRPAAAPHFLIGADGFSFLGGQSEAQDEAPFMDHWSASRPHVSLRDIMTEEQVLQEDIERSRQGRAELERLDGATRLKQSQLYELFPSIDRHFLQEIFRDNNYCLEETELFLRSLLDEGPVKTVVAPAPQRPETQRTPSKERDKGKKVPEPQPLLQPPAPLLLPQPYQDVEDPEYEDFRAEASLQRGRQHECFSKAAEAYRQGSKDVASFYAQQGHLHGQRRREADHRAAMQIFQQVNASLLPQNILDLHGLHVDEALQHLGQVLHDKTSEWEQGLCRPQLSVITGRGNHSQGGVARIRPAVIDYLSSQRYRYSEPKPGVVLVSLN